MKELNWDHVSSETQDKMFDAVHVYLTGTGRQRLTAMDDLEKAYRQARIEIGVQEELDRRDKAAREAKATGYSWGNGSLNGNATTVVNGTAGYVSLIDEK